MKILFVAITIGFVFSFGLSMYLVFGGDARPTMAEYEALKDSIETTEQDLQLLIDRSKWTPEQFKEIGVKPFRIPSKTEIENKKNHLISLKTKLKMMQIRLIP